MSSSNDLRAVLDEYTKSLEEGRTGNCDDQKLESAVRTELLESCTPFHNLLQWDVFSILSSSQSERRPLSKTLEIFIKAFEVLELAAVNIYIFPWRKEFKVIKTFSGTYVHYFKPALSDHDIAKILKMLGYYKKDEYHLELLYLPNLKELAKLACGFYVAKIECRLLLDIVQRLDHGNVALTNLIRERKASRNLDECVDRLKKLYCPQMMCSKYEDNLAEVAASGDAVEDLYTDESNNLLCNTGGVHTDSRLSTTKTESLGERVVCDLCKEDWTVHAGGFCPNRCPERDKIGSISPSGLNGRLEGYTSKYEVPICERCHYEWQNHAHGFCPVVSHEVEEAVSRVSSQDRSVCKTHKVLGEDLEFNSGHYNLSSNSSGGWV
ncbi:spermatogenesis-associated protein 2-like protein [Protopterus annectens]|uniref:spermatogenesis-associated protein 2-like protein n=1 Tax=Protopterus annectens TaxID=7888 RepID=UPI001CFB5FA7|nr:spermatogenesis-associated protein 2-like protein [Protopterus annectens]XP_043937799.1 spermatogenesis-associated protein 2-like protein [Protopterus annectens]